MPIEIVPADLDDPAHCAGVVNVLDSYASDPVGGGTPLSADVRQRLIPGLRDHSTTFILLAIRNGRAVGVLVGFFGFSTFQARPLLNIHDLAIVPECRGHGIGRQLLTAAEAAAQARGCCKLTLEVQDDNHRALGLYKTFGFADVTYGDSGPTRFLSKPPGGAY